MYSLPRQLVNAVRERWRAKMFRFPVALGALLCVVAAVLFSLVHAGHDWNGDFAQYLMHAQNIVEGQPYAEMPYVRNPVNNNPGPPAYPPGFPLLLAPVYAVFGTAIIPMKMFIIATFIAALCLTAYLFRAELPTGYTLTLVAVLGFNPYLVEFTSSVVSDVPFLLFVLLSLATWRLSEVQTSIRWQSLFAVLAGLLTYYAVLIRSLGVVLPVSILIYELLAERRLSRRALIGLGTFGLVFGVQTVLSILSAGATASAGISYYQEMVQQTLLERLPELGGEIVQSISIYAEMTIAFVWGPATTFVGPDLSVLGGLTLLLMVAGWLYHVFSRFSAFDVFTPLYVAALLPWTFHWMRYLFPVLPFFVFYALYALNGIRQRLRWKHPILVTCIAGLLIGLYGWELARTPPTPNPTGALTAEAERMYQHIRTHTSPEALIVFGKPRFVALKTGRQSVCWFTGRSDDELLDYFTEAGVDYVLVGPPEARPWGNSIIPLIESYPSRFSPTYESRHYTLYRFISQGETAEGLLPHGLIADRLRHPGDVHGAGFGLGHGADESNPPVEVEGRPEPRSAPCQGREWCAPAIGPSTGGGRHTPQSMLIPVSSSFSRLVMRACRRCGDPPSSR